MQRQYEPYSFGAFGFLGSFSIDSPMRHLVVDRGPFALWCCLMPVCRDIVLILLVVLKWPTRQTPSSTGAPNKVVVVFSVESSMVVSRIAPPTHTDEIYVRFADFVWLRWPPRRRVARVASTRPWLAFPQTKL